MVFYWALELRSRLSHPQPNERKSVKKLALITGASSGLGYEFAKLCAQESYEPILVARRKERLDSLKQEIERDFSVACHVIPLDLLASDCGETLFTACKQIEGSLEIVINNAGFGEFGDYGSTDGEKEANSIKVNVLALTSITKSLLPLLKENNSGYICNVASTAAFQPLPRFSVYGATKAYVLSYSQAIGAELEEFNIKVSCLCPGPTDTEFFSSNNMEDSTIANRKLPTSSEVAEYGYRAMKKGKPVAIHGSFNWLMAVSGKFAPQRLVVQLAKKMMTS